MPAAKKRAAASQDSSDDEHGEGYMALGEPSPAAAPKSGRRQHQTPSGDKSSTEAAVDQGSRVVYIGNLPHGFYEKQLLGFFSQFGKLTKVRLSRSKKTAKAKHYAFLEFQYPEVAKISAEAMDGYFLLKQKLTCKVMQPDKIHPLLFKGANKKFRDIPWRKLERQRHDKERSPEEQARRLARLIKKDKKRQQRIKDAGMDYEYSGLEDSLPVKPKKIKIL